MTILCLLFNGLKYFAEFSAALFETGPIKSTSAGGNLSTSDS